ncbi:diacylglycerol/lipid kinase family protein [Ructibacterium gallinarum]|uniref:YegS/Rv2252/BmrU family lipid kinase n=1 Tax=Ructibacterium gallinarum TaxID=2779355 RepID=A0A9D5M4N7_9FIRM|nr:YegS/Rv2252/BmrU family lipid kinase [Ructibacterium gallinarum]MBE5039377.1 YegS/Rv2252/BmrU family lipid kinase [Ructibacterium gallinarum]
MKKQMLFLYNPMAGKGRIKARLSDVFEIFAHHGFEITVHPTLGAGDVTQIVAEKAEQFDYILIAGGDGTLHELAEGLMRLPKEQRPPCGYIPAGTVNDFASSLSIPKQILRAAQLAAEGVPAYFDIGEMNGHFFTYIAGFGAFTEVAYETSQATKNALGKMAYFLDGAKRITSLKRYPLRLTADGNPAFEGDVLFGMVTNSYSVGGFRKMMNEHIALNDGIFEAVLVKAPSSLGDLNQTLIDLTMQNRESRHLIYCRGSSVSFSSPEPLKWTLDGEFGGSYCETGIVCHQKAIAFVVKEKEELISD